MYYLSNVCVVCLNSKGHYHKILKTNSDDAQILHKLYTCEFLTDFLDINASFNICNKCFHTLHIAYEFTDMCRKNTIILRNYITQLKHVMASGIHETEREHMHSEPAINLSSSLVKEEKNITTEEATMDAKEQDTVKVEILVDPVDTYFHDLIRVEHNMEEEADNVIKDEEYSVEERVFPNSRHEYIDINHCIVQLKSSIIHQNEIKQENVVEVIIEKSIDENENAEAKHIQMCNTPVMNLNLDELKEEKDGINIEEDLILEEECLNIKPKVLSCMDADVDMQTDPTNNVIELVNDNITFDMSFHISKENYECIVCKKKISNLANLKRHMLIHTGEKNHQCTVCMKRFTQLISLKRHMLVHTNEKNYQCTVCEKRFTQSVSLKRHIPVHTNEKNYRCTVCEKKFTQPYYLKTHMQIHTDNSKYQCTVCEKRFSSNSYLNKHARIHTGE